jgi:hypothetical protein
VGAEVTPLSSAEAAARLGTESSPTCGCRVERLDAAGRIRRGVLVDPPGIEQVFLDAMVDWQCRPNC